MMTSMMTAMMTEPAMMVAESNRAAMRVAALLLGLMLAGCSGASLVSAPPDAGSTPARPSAGGGGGARGGASTAAARGEPVEVPPDPVVQARAQCWMKVEGQKALRGLDQRIGFVDKCVAETIKTP